MTSHSEVAGGGRRRWTEVLAAAELRSSAAAAAPSAESRTLSRLAGCLQQGWEQERMRGWPGRKVLH